MSCGCSGLVDGRDPGVGSDGATGGGRRRQRRGHRRRAAHLTAERLRARVQLVDAAGERGQRVGDGVEALRDCLQLAILLGDALLLAAIQLRDGGVGVVLRPQRALLNEGELGP
jgi:hypothetical protein